MLCPVTMIEDNLQYNFYKVRKVTFSLGNFNDNIVRALACCSETCGKDWHSKGYNNWDFAREKQDIEKNCTTYGHPLPDTWPRIVKQLGMLQVAEQSLSPRSWTCLNIRHAGARWRENGWPWPGFLSVAYEACVPRNSTAPCSQTVQTLSGIRRGAPAGTLHPPRQGRHRGFMSTVPCMDLRIFQNTSPSPRPPVRLKPEPHLPPLNPAGSTLPGNLLLFFSSFFFNFSPPFPLWPAWPGPAWPGLAWPKNASSLSH